MTLEISPVLAGTYDAPDYTPPHPLNSTQSDVTDEIDSRRYTKYDRSATDAGSTTDFSFGDFLDMINPLEHIPVISSIYREIVGENINPVSRVVGDIMYGGAAGIASGVISAVGAVGDSVAEAQTGKDTTGNVIAALFEDNKSSAPPAMQLAQAGTPPVQTQTQTPTKAPTSAQINARAKLQAAAVAAAAASAVQASMPSTGTSSPAAQMASASSSAGSGLLDQLTGGNPAMGLPLGGTKTFALDPKKLPYGGVMAPPLQGNNMGLSLASSAPGLQMNHTVYTSLKSGVKPSAVPVAPAPPPVSAVAADTPAPSYVSTAAPDALPPALMSDIATLRAVNQYRSTAQTGSSSPSVNVIN